MEHRYLPHYRSAMKNCFPCKISLKSGNQLLSYGQKRLLKLPTCAILYFKNVRIWSSGCHRVPNVHGIVYQISSTSHDFSLRYSALTICNMADVSHLEISKFRVYKMWPLSPCYSASLCKISLKSHYRLLSYVQKTIYKTVDIRHREF